MPVIGDFSGLTKLIAQLNGVARGQAFKAAGRAIADDLQGQLVAGFDEGRSPDGVKWAPLKSGGGRPLLAIGDTAKSKFTASAVTLTVGFKWAGVHQHGATIVPKTERTASNWHGRKGKLTHDAGRTSHHGGVLVFTVAGRKVFAKKVVIPARPMLPPPGEMPSRWQRTAEFAAREVVLVWLGG